MQSARIWQAYQPMPASLAPISALTPHTFAHPQQTLSLLIGHLNHRHRWLSTLSALPSLEPSGPKAQASTQLPVQADTGAKLKDGATPYHLYGSANLAKFVLLHARPGVKLFPAPFPRP